MWVEHIPIQDVHSNAAAFSPALSLHDDVGTAENQTSLTALQFAAQILFRNAAWIRPAQQVCNALANRSRGHLNSSWLRTNIAGWRDLDSLDQGTAVGCRVDGEDFVKLEWGSDIEKRPAPEEELIRGGWLRLPLLRSCRGTDEDCCAEQHGRHEASSKPQTS
jgi:hypothetical protein